MDGYGKIDLDFHVLIESLASQQLDKEISKTSNSLVETCSSQKANDRN